ncbi:hypothetical protein QOT17_018944 [Balamuthia mandrillaris]
MKRGQHLQEQVQQLQDAMRQLEVNKRNKQHILKQQLFSLQEENQLLRASAEEKEAHLQQLLLQLEREKEEYQKHIQENEQSLLLELDNSLLDPQIEEKRAGDDEEDDKQQSEGVVLYEELKESESRATEQVNEKEKERREGRELMLRRTLDMWLERKKIGNNIVNERQREERAQEGDHNEVEELLRVLDEYFTKALTANHNQSNVNVDKTAAHNQTHVPTVIPTTRHHSLTSNNNNEQEQQNKTNNSFTLNTQKRLEHFLTPQPKKTKMSSTASNAESKDDGSGSARRRRLVRSTSSYSRTPAPSSSSLSASSSATAASPFDVFRKIARMEHYVLSTTPQRKYQRLHPRVQALFQHQHQHLMKKKEGEEKKKELESSRGEDEEVGEGLPVIPSFYASASAIPAYRSPSYPSAFTPSSTSPFWSSASSRSSAPDASPFSTPLPLSSLVQPKRRKSKKREKSRKKKGTVLPFVVESEEEDKDKEKETGKATETEQGEERTAPSTLNREEQEEDGMKDRPKTKRKKRKDMKDKNWYHSLTPFELYKQESNKETSRQELIDKQKTSSSKKKKRAKQKEQTKQTNEESNTRLELSSPDDDGAVLEALQREVVEVWKRWKEEEKEQRRELQTIEPQQLLLTLLTTEQQGKGKGDGKQEATKLPRITEEEREGGKDESSQQLAVNNKIERERSIEALLEKEGIRPEKKRYQFIQFVVMLLLLFFLLTSFVHRSFSSFFIFLQSKFQRGHRPLPSNSSSSSS